MQNLVAMQVVGNLELNARKYADAIFGDTPISAVATQENLNRFVSQKDESTVAAVSAVLGIDLRTANAESFAAAISQKRDSGELENYREGVTAVNTARGLTEASGELPIRISAQKNGAVRYTAGGSDYAVIRNGTNYRIYDYTTGQITKSLSTAEAFKIVGEIKRTAQSGSSMNMLANTQPNTQNTVRSENSGSERENSAERRSSFMGYAEDGKGKYRSNFPQGTPKTAKSQRILSYIQNVWSKKPIKLNIKDKSGKVVRSIEAKFDPYYTSEEGVLTDAAKLMGGNRHGTASDQRVTLDLADDYYQIASEADYNYSKQETGKEKSTHKDVKEWHYFVNDIYFAEYDSDEYKPYTVSINVKEKADGSFVYSFSAEKNSESITRRTLHADVTGAKSTSNDELTTTSIHQKAEKSNTQSKKTSENSRKSLSSEENSGENRQKSQTPVEKMRAAVIRIFCKENIPEYAKLSAAEREAVEMTVRQARGNGMSDADAALFGRIAAKSGMNIYVVEKLEGENAFYDGRNGIYINASADRGKIYSGLLGHEMFHKIFKFNENKQGQLNKKASKLYNEAYKRFGKSKKRELKERYIANLTKNGYTSAQARYPTRR